MIEIAVRDTDLAGFTRQTKIATPTNITSEIAETAMEIFRGCYTWRKPIRSVTVRAASLVPDDVPWQTSLFTDPEKRERLMRLDAAVDSIRKRFGNFAIRRGLMLTGRGLSALDAQNDNTIHPHSFMERGNKVGIEEYMTVL